MEFVYPGIIGILLIINFFTVYRIVRLKQKQQHTSPDEYTKGLNALVDHNLPEALEKLKRAAIKDTANIMAYIRIGDILRESNKFEGAIKIHRQLTVRKNLDKIQRLKIYEALVLDYMAAGQFEQAIEYASLMLALDKDNLWALEKQLECYECSAQWEQAFELKQKLQKRQNSTDKRILALYKVEQAKFLLQKGQEKEALGCFKEARKLDETCAPAYLEQAEYLMQHNQSGDALKILKSFVENVPGEAHLAFENLKIILFELGHFSEVEVIYQAAFQKNPDNIHLLSVMAEMSERKGKHEEAVAYYNQILARNPNAMSIWLANLKCHEKTGQYQAATELVFEWLQKIELNQKRFRCQVCLYEAEKPFWLCPECHSWDSAEYQF